MVMIGLFFASHICAHLRDLWCKNRWTTDATDGHRWGLRRFGVFFAFRRTQIIWLYIRLSDFPTSLSYGIGVGWC